MQDLSRLPFLLKQKASVYLIVLYIINHLNTKFTFHASCKEGNFCRTQGTINSRSIKIRGCWGHTRPIITPSTPPPHKVTLLICVLSDSRVFTYSPKIVPNGVTYCIIALLTCARCITTLEVKTLPPFSFFPWSFTHSVV